MSKEPENEPRNAEDREAGASTTKQRDLEEIRKILHMMRENDLSVFKLEDGPFRLCLKRNHPVPAVPTAPAPVASPPVPSGVPETSGDFMGADAGLVDIPSPMVGTFYRASGPDADSLVSIGQEVDEDTVVCIIEAMKVMNEVKAEVRGVIRRVLADNATPVQYGQPLFKVEPR